MSKSKMLVLLAAPALLCGCAQKCTFEEFQKKVSEISYPDGMEITKASFSYKVGDKKGSTTLEGDFEKVGEQIEKLVLSDPLGCIFYGLIMSHDVYEESIIENKELTYFAGSTFKVEGNKDGNSYKAEYDKYGLCTLMETVYQGDVSTITASYSYTK